MRRLGEGSETPRPLQSTDPAASLSPQKLRLARDTLREIVGPEHANSLSDKEVAQFCELVAQRHDIPIVKSLFDDQKAAIKDFFQKVYGDREPASTTKSEKPAWNPVKVAPRSEPKQARIRSRSKGVAPRQGEIVDDVLKSMREKGGPLHGITEHDYVAFGGRLVRKGVDRSDKVAVADAYKTFKDHRQTEIRRPTLGEKPFVRGEIGKPQPVVAPAEIGKPDPLADVAEISGTALMKAIENGSGTKDILALLNAPKKLRSDPTEVLPRYTTATYPAAVELGERSGRLVQDLRDYDALSPEERADKRTNPNPTDEYFTALTTVVNPHMSKFDGRNAITFSVAEDAEGGFEAICIWVEKNPTKRACLLRMPDSRGERPLAVCLHDIMATTDDKRKARQESRFVRLLDLGAGVICAPSPLRIALNKRPDLAIKLLEKSRADSASFLKELKKAHGQNRVERVQGLTSTCEALATCCANEDPAFAAARKEAGAQLALFISKLATKCDAFETAEILGKPWFDGMPKDQQKALLDRFAERLPGDIANVLNVSGSNPATLERCLSLLTLARDYESPAEDEGWKVLAKKIEGLPSDLKKKMKKKPLSESITEMMKTTKILVALYQLAQKALQPRFSAALVNLSRLAMARMTDRARETMLQMLDSEDRLAGLMDAARMTAQRVFERLQQLRAPGENNVVMDGDIMMVFAELLPVLTLAQTTRDPELIKLLRDAWGLLSRTIQGQLSRHKDVLQMIELLKAPPANPDM